MNLALKSAWKYRNLTYPNPAVGALILDKYGKIISIQAHKFAGAAHAELSAIIDAVISFGDKTVLNLTSPAKQYEYIIKKYKNYFKNFTIFVTLEPCNHTGKTPACSKLIKELAFKKVVIGLEDRNAQASGGINYLKQNGTQIVYGVLKDKCEDLIKPFLKYVNNQPYILFKIATTKNGVYTGGIISSEKSRKYVHKIRENIDLLVIGGNTVRIDRPTLDCRLTNTNKAPDILIYTHKKSFDANIPLFNVKNREVIITDNLNIISKYKNILIEGGNNLFHATKDIVDEYLIFTSPNFKTGQNIDIDLNLKRLYNYDNGFDTIEWFKKL